MKYFTRKKHVFYISMHEHDNQVKCSALYKLSERVANSSLQLLGMRGRELFRPNFKNVKQYVPLLQY